MRAVEMKQKANFAGKRYLLIAIFFLTVLASSRVFGQAISTTSNALDRINFGDTGSDPYSESTHSFVNLSQPTGTGALGLTYREIAASTTASQSGIDADNRVLTFTMACNPTLQNYLTIQVWGSDTINDFIYLYNSTQGYVSGNYYGTNNPEMDNQGGYPVIPGRWLYETESIPLSMTQGKTSVTLTLDSANLATGQTSRPIYSAFTHTNPYLIVSPSDPQGTAPTTGVTAPTPTVYSNAYFESVLSQINDYLVWVSQNQQWGPNWTEAVNEGTVPPQVVGTFGCCGVNNTPLSEQWSYQGWLNTSATYSSGSNNVSMQRVEMLSYAYSTPNLLPSFYQNPTTEQQIVAALDSFSYMQPLNGCFGDMYQWDGLIQSGSTFTTQGRVNAQCSPIEGQGVWGLGAAIYEMQNDSSFKTALNQPINSTLEPGVLRYQAYQTMLTNWVASNDHGHAPNQDMLAVKSYLWTELALRALDAIYSTSLAASNATMYSTNLNEATGLAPIVNVAANGYWVSQGGLGLERNGSFNGGFDGGYGQVDVGYLSWLAQILNMTGIETATGSHPIRTVALNATKAFSNYIYPGLVPYGSGYQTTMLSEQALTFRNNSNVGIINFQSEYWNAAELNDPYALHGFYLEAQNGLTWGGPGGDDGEEGQIHTYLDYVHLGNMYNAQPNDPSGVTWLNEPTHGNGAWADPSGSAITIQNNGEAIRMTLNWRPDEIYGGGITLSPTEPMDNVLRVHDTTQTMDRISTVMMPSSAATGASGSYTSGATPGTLFVGRYGNYLIGLNQATSAQTLTLPPDMQASGGTATDLMTGTNYNLATTTSISVPANNGAVALYQYLPTSTLSATSLNYGSVTLKVPSDKTVTLSNTGTGPLMIASMGISGSQSSDFAYTTTCGSTLAANASCAITIEYTPAASGAATATFSLTTSLSTTAQTIALSGTGVLIGNGTYVVTSVFSALALGDPGSSTTAGTGMEQLTVTSAANQQWTVNNLGNNVITLTNGASSMLLDVNSGTGSKTAGAVVDQWTADSDTWQQWTVSQYTNGSYELSNVYSGLVLDVYGAGKTVGESIDTWSYNGGGWQQWLFSAITTTTLTSSATTTDSGASVTLTATVTATAGTPTGTVTFYSGSTSLGTGTLNAFGIATLSTTALATGTDSLTATYVAATGFAASTSTAVAVTVLPPATTTALASSANPSNYGSSITLTATVTASSGTPGGTVTFYNGSTSLGNGTLNGSGVATLATAATALPVGIDSLKAIYGGSSSYSTSTSSTLSETVNPAVPTVVLASSASSIVSNASVTLTATVTASTGTPTGTVTFYTFSSNDTTTSTSLGSATLNGSGVATLATTALPVGTDLVTATYTATTDYSEASSTPLTETVSALIPNGTYTVTSVQSGLAVGDPGFSTTGGTLMQALTLNYGANETWTVTNVGAGAITLTNVFSGLVLEDAGISGANGNNMDQWGSNGGTWQQWKVTALAGGSFELTNVFNGLALDVNKDTGSTTSGAAIDQWTYGGNSWQQWTFTPVNIPNGTYTVTAGNSGLNLGVPNFSHTSGTGLEQLTVTAAPNQQWTVNNVGKNVVTLTNMASGMMLDVAAGAGSKTAGAVVDQWPTDNDTWQQWMVSPYANGDFELANVYSGLVLDVYGAGTTVGESIDTWSYNGGGWQQWKFASVGLGQEPCDVLSSNGTTCSAAYSVTRRMFQNYLGPLFQIVRTSDNTTMNLTTDPNGQVDISQTFPFCASTTCYISEMYDQTSNANNLISATGAMAPFQLSIVNGLPIVQNVQATGGTSSAHYRLRTGTTGIPKGNTAITEYEVRWNYWLGVSDGDFGDMEATVSDTGAGHMFALGYSTWGEPGNNGGYGPYYCIDRENGLDCGPQANSTTGGTDPAVSSGTTPRPAPPLFTLIGKYSPTTDLETIEMADATGKTTPLTTVLNTTPSFTYNMEGGISLCEGGDGTDAYCAFQEGMISSTTTTSSADVSLQSNIAGFYGTFQPASTGSYVGPGDLVSGATGWWGLRAYNNAYAAAQKGAAILQRASDNTTQTINVTTTGDLNVAAAQTFCASTTCGIEEWIDQTGSGHNQVQTTAADQAQLVFNCNNGSKVCAYYNGTSDAYTTTYSAATPQPFTLQAVYQKTNYQDDIGGAIISSYNESGGSSNLGEGNVAETAQMYSSPNNQLIPADSYVFISLTGVYNGASSAAYQNGFSWAESGLGTSSLGTTVGLGENPAGNGNNQYMIGYMDEVSLWPMALTAAQIGSVQTNQRLYWQF